MALQRGRIKVAKVEISGIRSLERQDLGLLLEKRPAKTLQSLRDSHHRVARAVAAGMPNEDIAILCGMSLNRISMLKSDPAFSDLVAHYRGVKAADHFEAMDPVIDHLQNVQLKALRQLSDQFDAADEEGRLLPVNQLVAVATMGLDRTGYGKEQKNVNVNVDFAAQLEAARRRSTAARPPLIEAQPSSAPQSVPQPTPAPTLPLAVGPSPFRRRIGGPR